MKKLLLVVLVLICMAPTYTDQLTADFSAGTTNNTNATNNSVILATSGSNYTSSGTFLSQIFYVGSNPTGTVSWTYSSPTGTSLLVNSRTGNTSTPDGTWSGFSSNYATNTGSTLTSPVGRFYQYRLIMGTTNGTRTPTVNSISLAYSQNGPNISSGTNTNLDEEDSGDYDFSAVVRDTVPLTVIQGRYRIGNGSYTAWAAMTNNSGEFYVTVSEPSPDWENNGGENITLQVRATNNESITTNETLYELIDVVNNAPVLNSISDRTGAEDENLTLTVTGSDSDGDDITWNTSHGTITKVSNAIANLRWAPTSAQTGLITVTITMSDGSLQDQETFVVNVSESNDPPIMGDIESQSGHYGDRIRFTISVTDADYSENLTYRVTPNLFDIEPTNVSNNTTSYTGLADFYALDDHRGVTNLIFYVTDGEFTDSGNASLSITYCGDNVCQTQENETSCRQDCADTTPISYLAVQLEDRICTNQSTAIQAFNASTRYECFYEGLAENDAAFCNQQEDVDLELYSIENELGNAVRSLSVNSTGGVLFTPPQAGEYKLIATHEDLITATRIFIVNDCSNDINSSQEIITYPKPSIEPPTPRPVTPPQEEEPTGAPVKNSLLSALLWYLIIPILMGALIFMTTQYYAERKDTDPQLLKMRLWYWEQHNKYMPTLEPYIDKVMNPIRPGLAKMRAWFANIARRFRR